MPVTRAQALVSANQQIVLHGHVIPLDVIAVIIEFLDFDSLKKASLACHWFRHECSHRLFRSCSLRTPDPSSAENHRVLRAGVDFIEAPERASRLRSLYIEFQSFGKGTKGPFRRLMIRLLAGLQALSMLDDLYIDLSLTGDQEVVFGELLATRSSFSPRLQALASDVNIHFWAPFLNCHPRLTTLLLRDVTNVSPTLISRLEPFRVPPLPHLTRIAITGPATASLLPISSASNVCIYFLTHVYPPSKIIPHISNASTPIQILSLVPIAVNENELAVFLDAVTEKASHIRILEIRFPCGGEEELHDRHAFYDVINPYLSRFPSVAKIIWHDLPLCASDSLFEAVVGLESLTELLIHINVCSEGDNDGGLEKTYKVYEKSEDGKWEVNGTVDMVDPGSLAFDDWDMP